MLDLFCNRSLSRIRELTRPPKFRLSRLWLWHEFEFCEYLVSLDASGSKNFKEQGKIWIEKPLRRLTANLRLESIAKSETHTACKALVKEMSTVSDGKL